MKRSVVAAFLFVVLGGVSLASVPATEFAKACLALDEATREQCACVGAGFVRNFDDRDQSYAISMLTLDEARLASIGGKFEDKNAKAVQAKMIPIMQRCMAK